MNTYADAITAPQAHYLNGLLDEAVVMLDRKFGITMVPDVEAGAAIQAMRGRVDQMTKREASAAITTAKTNNKLLRDEIAALEDAHGIPPVEAPEQPEYVTEVGMYRVGQQIFKVLPSRNSDRHYAKELTGFHFEGDRPVSDTDGTMKFAYAKGAMRTIRAEHRMTPEQEREFGKLIGHCVDCGKLLTDPRSIDWGKGPVCSDGYKH